MAKDESTKITLLDCTFRDGGYYNSWDFSPALVAEYLKAVESAKLDAVEIGFRFMPKEKYLGPFAYCTDAFLKTLPLPKKTLIGVMVNADEFIRHPKGPKRAVDLLFSKASSSPVQLVRVAVHFRDVDKVGPIALRLKQLGYTVGVNLMQAAGKPPELLAKAAETIRDLQAADVLYFADSLGNMDAVMVRKTVLALRHGWDGPLGIHAHNSMNQGVINSMAALDAGARWLDGTVLGMGRGPGNAQTEHLLIELTRRGIRASYADAVFDLALGSFRKMQSDFGWGPNLLYYLAAIYGIHPTYVQIMQGKGQYTAHQIIGAIESLRKGQASGYNSDRLEMALFDSDGTGRGSWKAKNWCRGRSVLLAAAGPSLGTHVKALESFISQTKPVVLCLNVKNPLPARFIDAYAASHKASLLLDAEKYRFLKKPLFAPMGRVPRSIREKLSKVKVRDFGMKVKKDSFRAGAKECVVPVPLVAAYGMALAEAGGAKEILLAGFDGYGAADPRQHEMNDLIRAYRSHRGALPIRAVTPTTYEVPQGSIYAPVL